MAASEEEDPGLHAHQSLCSSRKYPIPWLVLHSETHLRLQLFRFVNITFTTSALAIAIRIRLTESENHITGVLGASPYVIAVRQVLLRWS